MMQVGLEFGALLGGLWVDFGWILEATMVPKSNKNRSKNDVKKMIKKVLEKTFKHQLGPIWLASQIQLQIQFPGTGGHIQPQDSPQRG